jgi:hypothetical protein
VRPVGQDAKGRHHEHCDSIEHDAERRDGAAAEMADVGQGHAEHYQGDHDDAQGEPMRPSRPSRPQQEQRGDYHGGDHREQCHFSPATSAAMEQVEEEREGCTGEALRRNQVFQA